MAVSKSLVAYAVLSNLSEGAQVGDVIAGLKPIFSYACRGLSGKTFSPSEFSEKIKSDFGLDIHPYVLSALADKLRDMGILKEFARAGSSVLYRYCDSGGEVFGGEAYADVQERARESFSRYVASVGLSIAVTDELIDGLVRFVISLGGLDSGNGSSENTVLYSGYVHHCREFDAGAYQTILNLAEGALLAEAVLNIGSPSSTRSLKGTKIFLDTPVLLAYLDLSDKDDCSYCRMLLGKACEKGAQLYVLPHIVEEMIDVLVATTGEVLSGGGYGPLSVRLKGNPQHAQYANGVKADPKVIFRSQKIHEQSLALVSPYALDESFASKELGDYERLTAKQRDIQSVRWMYSLARGGITYSDFHQIGSVMVTKNHRIRRLCSALNVKEELVSPVLLDKEFAAIVWLMYGGQSKDISSAMLVANCAKSLSPSKGLLERVKKFFGGLQPLAQEQFEAVMTDARAIHFLSIKALGNPANINSSADLETFLEGMKRATAADDLPAFFGPRITGGQPAPALWLNDQP